MFGYICDICGLIPDPLHIRDHTKCRRDTSQIPGYRLLAQQEIHTHCLDIPLFLIDLPFNLMYAVRDLLILFPECFHHQRHRLLAEVTHLNQFSIQLKQLLLICLSCHQPNLPVI